MEENDPVEQVTPAAPEAAPAPDAAPAPAPEAAAVSAPEAVAPAPAPAVAHDPEALAALAEKASAQRLPAAEEEKATQLVRAGLLAGAEEIVPLLSKLGWAASSRGVAAAWPDLKATAKTAFIKALSQDEGEGSRRIRLSIARAFFKLPDLPNCTKLVLGACKEIRDKKTGAIETRDAQSFASVMIGKGKPWIAQISLAELKPADAAQLVHCALVAAFSMGGPPVTPLGVLKWAGEAGQLAELDETALAAITKGISRWSPKWANALRNEVPNAPEAILAALKPAQPEPEPRPEPAAESADEPTGDESAERDDDDDEDEDDDDGLPPELREEEPGDGDARRQRPVYVSKTVPPKDQRQQPPPQQQREREPKGPPPKSAQFNANEMLRQLESHIGWLKNELQFAEKKLRSRDDDRRQAKRKPDVPVIEGEPTPEELARLNVQLEARITELQARIDDLAIDAEARATSAGVFSGESLPPDAQLRALLGLKLAEHYADFSALEQEDRDLVIPQHYRTVLTEVFAVLKAEGVKLEQPATPAEQ